MNPCTTIADEDGTPYNERVKRLRNLAGKISDEVAAELGMTFLEYEDLENNATEIAVLWPFLAVHADKELPLRKGSSGQQNFEVFISLIILDRNSQVCFHNNMVTEELKKSAVHDDVHSRSHNHS